MMISIELNGKTLELKEGGSLDDLLRSLNLSAYHFAVAINRSIIPKSEYSTTPLHQGDRIEIVHAVGGG